MVNEHNGSSLKDIIDGIASRMNPPNEPNIAVMAESDGKLIQKLLQVLPSRERYVLEQYYFYERSLVDIGAELGVGEARVSQIKSRGLRLMREHEYIDELRG